MTTSGPPWAPDHPVLEALRNRRAKGHRPDAPADDLKIGLAVEGGGIRGVISAAMLCALEDTELITAFDGVYAASSGAINSAYFLNGDTWYPLSIYYDDLATRRFVDLRRLFRGQILDLDYAFEVIDNGKPLDYDAVITSPTALHVAVTLVDELRTEAATDFTSREDLRSALIASAWLPVALRGTAEFRGRRAVDGGVLTQHPYRLALDDGCTHVLSLSTRPIQPPAERLGLSQRYGVRHLNRIRPGLGDGYAEAAARYRGERRTLQRRMTEPGEAPYVLDLAPLSWMPMVKRHELDPGRIMAGARGAYEVMYCAIEGHDPALIRNGLLRAVPQLTIVAKEHGPAGRGRSGRDAGRAPA
ncbi:patatin-like phospholipase family protein [Streptomyces sp. DSM 44917]|uniref:Patatin-like phospholipase family protein n=1 Tax=Streptomyces boetiae TaxID=3075541 RepID=A0ABU2L627_9ACTN|nr:patatin-like phospholipase family protein [Streptomyces sp. DSM 44917]MDT0307008.1 patatin-like phospholipase family protein [Streptomyces sp. DSM 44917]